MVNLLCFYQSTLNEQLHVQNAECSYSIDIRSGECPYNCDVCNKAFSQDSSLITHKRTHFSVYPNICKVCKKHSVKRAGLQHINASIEVSALSLVMFARRHSVATDL